MDVRRQSTLSPRKLIEKTRHHLKTAPCFQDSVDEANRIDIDYKANPWWKARYNCWEVKGQIAEEYKILGPRICDELRKSCRESSLEVFVWPYMVGKSPKSARPVLVIASEDEVSREEAKAAIDQSDVLEHHRYFKLWPLAYLPTGPVNPVAMEDYAPVEPLLSIESFEIYYDPVESLRPVGMPIHIKHGRETLRRATANAVHNGVEYGYLTAAHAFLETRPAVTPTANSQTCFDFPFDNNSDSESNDSFGVEASSIYSGTSPEATGSDSASAASSQHSEFSSQNDAQSYGDPMILTSNSADSHITSADISASQSPYAELELLGVVSSLHVQLDCAVVRVTNLKVISFLRTLENVKRSLNEIVQVSEIRRANATAWTSRGPVQGSLLDLPLYLRLAGSEHVQSLYRFKYDGTIMMGDCGTLLVDTDTKEAYGYIVSNSQRRGVAFVIPAKPVFEISRIGAGWELLTLNTDIDWRSPHEPGEDLMVWESEPDLPNHLADWNFIKSEPRDIPVRNGHERLMPHEKTAMTTFLADSSMAHQPILVAPSTIGSLSSRGSIAWSCESPTYSLTAPSSLGDITELNQYETLDIRGDIGDFSRSSDNPPFSRSHSQETAAPEESIPNPAGWTSYQTQDKTISAMPGKGRTSRGRRKGLTASQRSHAALMRIVGACTNCQQRKEKCDPGTPCKSCLDHYKGDLVKHPCRNRLLSDLSKVFLDERFSWHPKSRSIASLIPSNEYTVDTMQEYLIPLHVGFGPIIRIAVHVIEIQNLESLVHEHVIYCWPPGASASAELHSHAVLPVVLVSHDEAHIQNLLDEHLSALVLRHFRQFPLYCSPLRILRHIYIFYRSLQGNTNKSRLLLTALKLLVLIHIGSDITVPDPSTDRELEQLMWTTVRTSEVTPAPCFIRAQLGNAIGALALQLMTDVLASLEIILLNRENDDWPIVLATLLVVLMAVESIQYHSARRPYHESYDLAATRPTTAIIDVESGVKSLFAFYFACYPGCHERLRPNWLEIAPDQAPRLTPETTFIESLRDAIWDPISVGYLNKKAVEQHWDGEDMNFFFDRLIARLLTSQS